MHANLDRASRQEFWDTVALLSLLGLVTAGWVALLIGIAIRILSIGGA